MIVQFPDINAGAELAAAGKTLGMSPDETYEFVMRKIQLGNAKRARQGLPPVPESEAFRGFLDKMARVRGIDEVYPADIDDKRTISNAQVEYGEQGNQDELQNFGGIDNQGRIKDVDAAGQEADKVRGKRDPNEIVRYYYDKVAKKPAQETFYAGDGQPIPERFQEAAKSRDFGVRERSGGEDQGMYVQRGDQRLFRQYGQEVSEPKYIDKPRYIEGGGNNANLAPAQQILREELGRLQAGIDQYGADAFPGIADVVGRIQDDLRVDNKAEAALAAELVRADARPRSEEERRRIAEKILDINLDEPTSGVTATPQGPVKWRRAANRPFGESMQTDSPQEREAKIQAIIQNVGPGNFNPEVAEANDWKADAVAQEIAQRRFGIGGGGAAADAAIGKIGDIQNLGAVKYRGPEGQAKVNMPVPGRQVEPTSLPIGLAGDLNAPVTDNRFAGPLQRQEQWLVDHAPGYREGAVFGDYPQVAIDAQLEGVGEALAKLKLGNQGIDPSYARVRNLNDLQAAADEVVRIAGVEGIKFYDRGEDGNVFNSRPGIDQVLNKARFNENQKNDLARALFQVEAANRNPANASRKARFKKGKPQPEGGEMGGRRLVAIEGADGNEYRVVRDPAKQPVGGAQHQLLGAGQVPIGRIQREKIEGREVKGELQKLDGRRADPPLDRTELRNARMPYQGVRGGEQAPRAGFIKGDVRGMSRAERVQKFGERNAGIANRIEDRYLESERRRNEPPAPDSFASKQRAADSAIEGQREARSQAMRDMKNRKRLDNVPDKVLGQLMLGNDQLQGVGVDVPELRTFPQAATSATVNPQASVSPEMGGGSIPPKPPVIGAAASDPQPEKYEQSGYKFRPDGASRGDRDRREIVKRLEQGAMRRRAGLAAGAGAAAGAGLMALIGGERDKREQEAQY